MGGTHVSERPQVINLYHYQAPDRPHLSPLPERAINVMRGTALGNPYERAYLERWAGSTPEIRAKVKADPFYVLEPYRQHLFKKLKDQDEGVIRMFSQIDSTTPLVCCCVRPDGSGVCHAHIIARAWRWWWDAGCPGLRVAIVGSKSWPAEMTSGQYPEINSLLLRIPEKAKILTRHVEGVDIYAYDTARHFEFEAEMVEVDRERDGKGAEFKRDHRLVNAAHWVYAFQHGKSTGTQHIINLATESGRMVSVQNK